MTTIGLDVTLIGPDMILIGSDVTKMGLDVTKIGLDVTIIGPGTEVHVASYGVLNSWRRTWTNAQDQEICC